MFGIKSDYFFSTYSHFLCNLWAEFYVLIFTFAYTILYNIQSIKTAYIYHPVLITNSLAIIKYRNFCILQSINTIYLHIPEATYETMKLRIADIINYIENLKLPSGQTILTSKRMGYNNIFEKCFQFV